MTRGVATTGRSTRGAVAAQARLSLRVAAGRTRGEARARPALHGRDVALRALDRRLDELADGRGGVVLVEGPPGAGRTSVLDHAQDRAERAGLRFRRGAGDPAARAMPLRPLLDALLRGPDPVLDAHALRGVAAIADGGFWLVHELHERLERAALDAPYVVAVDDVGWADDLTLLALRTLPERLSAHAILWLIARRPGDAAVTAGALRDDGAETLALGALDRAAVAGLARDVLGAVPDDAVLDLACRVDPRPSFLVELLRGLRDEGLVRVEDDRARLVARRLPARFRDAVAARVAHLSEPAQEAVRMGSVLGRRFTAEQLAVLLGRATPDLVAPLGEALAAELLVEHGDALAFRHDLVREAVDAGLPATIRHALRRQAVALGVDRGASSAGVTPRPLDAAEVEDAHAAVTGELEAARAGGDLAAEVAALSSCSGVAYHRHRYQEALDRADEARALALAGGSQAPSPWPDVWAAWLRGCVGRLDEALPRSEEGLRAARREGRAADARCWSMSRGALLLSAGRPAEARAEAERVLATVDELGPGAAGTAAASQTLARVALRTGDRAALRAAARTAAAMRTDDAVTVRRGGDWLAALLADADGEPRRVLHLLDETLGVLGTPTPTLFTPHDPCELLGLLRVVLRTGHAGHAETVARETERRAALNPGFALHAALAAHARGLLERDAAALRASAARLAGRLGALARADVLEDAALVVAVEDRGEAVAQLDTALALHDAAGATRDAARVRRHLRDLGVRRRRPAAGRPTSGWAGLTRAELAVVELVAEGATNRTAAQRLHLSPHTVSSHLRHAFEKLGIRSRVELAVRFAEQAR